jgi:hypothetical protein
MIGNCSYCGNPLILEMQKIITLDVTKAVDLLTGTKTKSLSVAFMVHGNDENTEVKLICPVCGDNPTIDPKLYPYLKDERVLHLDSLKQGVLYPGPTFN